MKYKFFALRERVPYLVNELKNTTVIEDDADSNYVTFEVHIEYGTDLLDLFHAGIRLGMDAMQKVHQ